MLTKYFDGFLAVLPGLIIIVSIGALVYWWLNKKEDKDK